ncbi:hypothetical protein MKW98_032342 [Papaver atlanticum]|uniref:Uncharacterized protein n=1 Tax=Papaver atlanticum TaxID=357466 RepID=A0AAD4SEQ4_9MAGN|nr:hypothetical protein MKW98_032342 [Papaver atlanticum]
MVGTIQFGALAACTVLFVPMGLALSPNKMMFLNGALFISLATGMEMLRMIQINGTTIISLSVTYNKRCLTNFLNHQFLAKYVVVFNHDCGGLF